jgi:hypothetical protein
MPGFLFGEGKGGAGRGVFLEEPQRCGRPFCNPQRPATRTAKPSKSAIFAVLKF